MPLLAQQSGSDIIEFNLGRTPLSAYAREVILGPSADTLPAWWEEQQSQTGR